MREYQVRICEGLGVKFPGPTRQFGVPIHTVNGKSEWLSTKSGEVQRPICGARERIAARMVSQRVEVDTGAYAPAKIQSSYQAKPTIAQTGRG